MDHTQSIIVYLFTKGEPISRGELSRFLNLTPSECEEALRGARERIASLGLTLVDDGKEVELRTSASVTQLVEGIRKDEFSRDIGKAGIETLSIVLYKGPVSRSEIDYIRGVNSSHILRALSMRGLLRRIPHPKDERSFLYEPTTDLFAHLGIASKNDLPDYESVTEELRALESVQAEEETAELSPSETT